MKKSLYICNANNSEKGNLHTKNTALSVFSGVTSVIRCGLFAKHIQGVRSLFVHTRKTCYTMRTTNKQATKAKNSNLSARTIYILLVLATLCIGTLLLIFAPDILMVIGKFLGCVALVSMAVVPMLYPLIYKPYESNKYYRDAENELDIEMQSEYNHLNSAWQN